MPGHMQYISTRIFCRSILVRFGEDFGEKMEKKMSAAILELFQTENENGY